jgi:hypothetical protein
MRVDYFVDLLTKYSEWVLLEHAGYPKTKAIQWWISRTGLGATVPTSAEDAVKRSVELRTPFKIAVRKNGKFDEIVGVQEWVDPCKDLYNKAMTLYKNHREFLKIEQWALKACEEGRKEDLIELIGEHKRQEDRFYPTHNGARV